ncbi:nitroreductase family protein [Lachnospiraceae bacterium KM106-2]|nr:nitroreductase family protein [Lachnospiraceae bacterium KM106-2]
MQQFFSQPITDIIGLRHSVRNYESTPLPNETIEKIEQFINTLKYPFPQKVRITLIDTSDVNSNLKLGTYGVIKGARYFLITACEKDTFSQITLGYCLEKVVLYCTSLGLGTVWLGGTFRKSNFAKAISLSDHELLPIVSPVGIEGGKKSFLGSFFGKSSKIRKDFSTLFFQTNFSTPLTPEQAHEFYEPLEMLRLAPSAVNKQPWRVLMEKGVIHFYLDHPKGLNFVDLGIALCHFHLTALELELKGHFHTFDNLTSTPKCDFTYVISWIIE